jgi:hypothetical protein
MCSCAGLTLRGGDQACRVTTSGKPSFGLRPVVRSACAQRISTPTPRRSNTASASFRPADQVELATLDYVDWYDQRRLCQACGDIPPADLETAYYRQNTSLPEAS